MRKTHISSYSTLVLLLAGLFLGETAIADDHAWQSRDSAKPERDNKNLPKNRYERSENRAENKTDYAGNNAFREQQRQGEHGQWSNQQDRQRQGAHVSNYFNEQHREHVHSYYQQRYHAGRCPPGLAKRQNGCLPPGLERRWQIGYPLPQDVIFYDLPPRVVMELGPPPPHHRFVRVAADILLIAIGTGIVVDAIEDLGY